MSHGVVLVTGGTGGLGRAIVRRLAADGFEVVVNYRSNEQHARALAEEASVRGERIRLSPADLLDEQARAALLDTLGESVFGLVHAAVAPVKENWFLRTERDAFGLHWHLAVEAPAALLRKLLPRMIEARQGAVVWVLTTAVLNLPPKHLSAYVSAKMAALGLMRSLAIEYAGKGIRFNAVSPGFTETALTATTPEEIRELYRKRIPMGRFGTPEDVAASISYLLSPQASFVTGVNLPVAGGAAIS